MYISSSTEAPTNIAINTVEFTIHVIPSFSIFFTNFRTVPDAAKLAQPQTPTALPKLLREWLPWLVKSKMREI